MLLVGSAYGMRLKWLSILTVRPPYLERFES